jgi:hypothetical protein
VPLIYECIFRAEARERRRNPPYFSSVRKSEMVMSETWARREEEISI